MRGCATQTQCRVECYVSYTTITNKELMMNKQDEYREYIKEHINNVNTVWGTYLKLNDVELDIRTVTSYLVKNHDQSKYSNDEFHAYRNNFFPDNNDKKNKKQFKEAWNHHQKHNKHHWQYWIMWKLEGSIVLEMDEQYILEMLCDWTAMSYKFNQKNVTAWYEKEMNNMFLGKQTRKYIEDNLCLFDDVLYYLSTKCS